MSNFTNVLSIVDEAPAFLHWHQVDFNDVSEFMLDRMGLAARENKLELYVLANSTDKLTWAIGRQLNAKV